MSNQFTADNIVGILRAVPESDGSFKDVSEKAEAHGLSLSPFTIGCWVMRGREDLRRLKVTTAHARFAKEYDKRVGLGP